MGASAGTRLRITLQHKLLAVILVCVLVPAVGMGVYLMSLSQRTLRAKVHETVENHLLRKESALAGWMGERLRESARWSASFVVYEGLEALTRPGGSADVQRDLAAYLESILGHYRVYESFFIVDTKGNVLAATRDERLEEWVTPLLSSSASSDVAQVSPLRRSAHLGRATQVVLQPIFAPRERGGDPLGFFVMRLDLRELEAVLAQADVETAEEAAL
ncbi:MAG TPA: hypothetical protein VFM29_08045, partial [Vicinamibacteria bacterium]|nr:hypothetical protein [Vicinamibacteria bacterium]